MKQVIKKKVFNFIMCEIIQHDYFSNSKIRVLKNIEIKLPLIRSNISELCREGFLIRFGTGFVATDKAFQTYERYASNYLKNSIAVDHLTPKIKIGIDAIIKEVFTLSRRKKLYKLNKEERVLIMKKLFIDTSLISTKRLITPIFNKIDDAILFQSYETKKELFAILSAFVCPYVATYYDSQKAKRQTFIQSKFLQMGERTITKKEALEILGISSARFEACEPKVVKVTASGRKYYSLLLINRLKNRIKRHDNKQK
jgi:hypothetical protein